MIGEYVSVYHQKLQSGEMQQSQAQNIICI